MGIEKALRLFGGLVVTGLIARQLGSGDFGLLSSVTATIGLLSIVAYLGNESTAAREIAHRPDDGASILGAVILSRACCACMIAMVFWALILMDWSDGGRHSRLLLIASAGLISPVLAAFGLWFVGVGKAHLPAVVSLIGVSISLGVRLLLLYREAGLEAYIWAGLVESLVTGSLLCVILFRVGGKVSFSHALKETKVLFAGSWPLLIGAVATAVYTRIDILFISWMRGSSEAGIYAAATRVSEAAYAIPAYFGGAVTAALVKEFKQDGGFGEIADRYHRSTAALAYLITIPLVAFLPLLIRKVFGDEYAHSASIAQIHVLTVFFMALGVARGRLLVVQGWTRFAMVSAISGCVINLILNLILVPSYGAKGAAVAALFAHAFSSFGITYCFPPTRPIAVAQFQALLRPRWKLGNLF